MVLLLKNKWDIINEAIDDNASLLDSVLSTRGMTSDDDRKLMLEPEFNEFNDPFLFKDMKKACDHIFQAVSNRQKIVIYGDYDADGIASTSILFLFLQKIGADVSFIIPDRISEGYGLTDSGVAKLVETETRLVITVDCGISSCDEIRALNNFGIQVILTDHHECKPEIPDAAAIINPKVMKSGYPFKDLAGVGVVLKLIQALCFCFDVGDIWKSYIDIAALGTIADIVPLVGENRMIVYHGLKKMNYLNNIGMKNLFTKIDLAKKEITVSTISYGIAPRLNAAGRMGDSKRSVRLLTSSDNDECNELADELVSDNIKRQEIETEIFNAAKEWITGEYDFSSNEIIVVYKMGWHHGIIGIVASKLAELFCRPVMVFGGENGLYKGSARSYNGSSILEAIEYANEFVLQFGGHMKAAGLVVREEMMDGFVLKIKEYSKEHMIEKQYDRKITIDFEIPFWRITLENAKEIARLAPFGEGNPQPVFITRNLIVDQIRFLSAGRHMKLSLKRQSSDGMPAKSGINETLDAIAFGFAEKNSVLSPGDIVDIAYTMEINEWNGNMSVQIVVKDIRKSSQKDSNDCMIPQKADFAAVYRYIKMNYPEDTVICDLDLLADMISNIYRIFVNAFKLARIFDIFKEVGLIDVAHCGYSRIKFRLVNNKSDDMRENVSLSKSETYQAICMGNQII